MNMIKVRYETTKKECVKPGWYHHIQAIAYVNPVRIFRRACGTGAAANRFYYEVVFKDPGDAEYVRNGEVTTNINRKENPRFNPKKIKWDGNTGYFTESSK